MATTKSLMSFVFKDELGVTAAIPFYINIDTTQTVTSIGAEALTLGGLLNPLTDAQVIRILCGTYVTPSGSWNTSPLAGSRVSKTATCQFGNVSNTCLWGIDIPSIKAAKLTGNHLNTADSQVQAFINHIKANSGNFLYCTDGGLNLNTFSSSFLGIWKYRHATQRQSYQVG